LAHERREGALTDDELDAIQFTTVQYYLHEINPFNGLVRDKTFADAPASIAACGMAWPRCRCSSSAPVAAREHRQARPQHLKYLYELPQGRSRTPAAPRLFFTSCTWAPASASGTANSPPSTAPPLRGILTCATYFDLDDPTEASLRDYAAKLYEAVD